jgi:phage tail-like protein
VTTTRLIEHLPAIYRGNDDLDALLSAFDDLLFGNDAQTPLPGVEYELRRLPSLFAPIGSDSDDRPRTPTRFLPWLASWLAFAPHRLFEPEELRRIVAGIVPLYGRRGTRAYLEQLLALCFEDVAQVQIEERLEGLCLGRSRVGVDSWLSEERPFWFSVDVRVRGGAHAAALLEQRVRAVIDFAKPAHTTYDLQVRPA